jgi:undecaprenyl-diphosphatase
VTSATGGELGFFEAVILGLVEGITEFLPVSSTGHLIVAERLLGLGGDSGHNAFLIGIQIGAITAILVLYGGRLTAALRTIARPVPDEPNLLWQIALAAAPAAVVGLLCDDWIDAHLFSPAVVAATTIGGGVLLLLLERWLRHREAAVPTLATMRYRTAFWIGVWQCLALIPGTSRSAATFAGALVLGLSRTAAAEFSFLVGLPILYGAGGYKLLRHGDTIGGPLLLPFLVGTAVAFVSALLVVRPFVRFLRDHTFVPFAWYRVVAGVLLAIACVCGFFQ